VDIAFVSLTRERAHGEFKASATYTFSIVDGVAKTRAEVILTDGAYEVIEQRGKNPRQAAELALRSLTAGCNPFTTPIFLRVPYRDAKHFLAHGDFGRGVRANSKDNGSTVSCSLVGYS